MSVAVTELPDPRVLATKTRALLDQGRPGAAQPLVAAMRAVGADAALTAELEARLLFAQGRAGEATAALTAALTDSQSSPALFLARAELRLFAGDARGAASDAAEAVVLEPRDSAAKALLGRALLQLGHAADAVVCLDEALTAQPLMVSTRLDLAAALDAVGLFEPGEAVIADGTALQPANAALRSAILMRRIRAGDFEGALTMAEAARQHGALDACGFGLVGHALASLGRHGDATEAYAEALKLAPDDPYVRHLVAAAGRSDAGERAPPDYVRALFNGYAGHFDDHLIHLGYRVPGLVRGLVERCPKAGGPVLDLGCGTGLLALTCADVAPGDWVGVDLSPQMLGAARAKALYAELHEADLFAYLAAETRAFPLILAGDVLCYFGDLHALMHVVVPRLMPGGRFICTVEHLESGEDTTRLGRMGRYAHSRAHVVAAARDAGLAVASVAEEVLRHDGGAPVHGLLLTLQCPA